VRAQLVVFVLAASLSATSRLPGWAQQRCHLEVPAPVLTIPYVTRAGAVTADPAASMWAGGATASLFKDCTRSVDYPDLKTEIRAFWTDTHVYFLFVNPYRALNVFLPAQGDEDRDKLWDRDVVEMFLGDDWKNIERYREFEIAPTGDRVDLAIDFERKQYDQTWSSGWQTAARVDEEARIWYAAARIPLSAVSVDPVEPGTRWRMNLYRIDGERGKGGERGEGPDAQRRFLCWQPTCVVDRDPNHVPEAFGTLIFAK